MAVHVGGGLQRARTTSRAAKLMSQVSEDYIEDGTGIAHTRWATHDAPAVHNAHPHFSHGTDADTRPGRIALVHNGIIEYHDELRAALQVKGYVFHGQTDTEVIAHLVDSIYDGDSFEAVTWLPTSARWNSRQRSASERGLLHLYFFHVGEHPGRKWWRTLLDTGGRHELVIRGTEKFI